MKKIYFLVLLSIIFSCQKATTPQYQSINKEVLTSNGSTMLIGRTTFSGLSGSPYNRWFEANKNAYEPDTNVVNKLKSFKEYKIVIYGGTWCGDTRRDLPKFSKVMTSSSITTNRYEMYMVDHARNKNYKQSPDKTQYASSIFRVPTFIIERNGQEIGRIIEEPIETFEKDLLKILKGESYTPSYALVNQVQNYVHSGQVDMLKDPKVLDKLEKLKVDSGGLNSLGYMMMYQESHDKALAVFELNTILFPDDANTFDSMGEFYFLTGKPKLSRKYYELALQLDPGLESAQEMLLKM